MNNIRKDSIFISKLTKEHEITKNKSIRSADQILVMDDDRLIQKGTHAELIMKCLLHIYIVFVFLNC